MTPSRKAKKKARRNRHARATRSKRTIQQLPVTPSYLGEELAGLDLCGTVLPAPAIGLETELGVIAPGSDGNVIPHVQSVLARRRGINARAAGHSQLSPYECDRQFDRLGSTYQEGDHLEVNTFLWRSAAAARHNLEQRFAHAAALARSDDHGVVLHATGGDCQGSSWSSLHVNTPISDLGYERMASTRRAVQIALDYYLPAQVSLSIVDGNGGIDPTGFVVSDRLGVFDAVFGSSTMRPSRAMLVDRSERFGNARIMHMIRALSFGEASIAGLVMTQLDCLICDLAIHGALAVTPMPLGDPVAAARDLSFYDRRHALADLARRVHGTRCNVVDSLIAAIGEEMLERLVPGVFDALEFVDRTLTAVRHDDEAELLARCDWARKLFVMRQVVAGGDIESTDAWSTAYETLVELNFHYARLDENALRLSFAEASLPPLDSEMRDLEPRDTSSWLLHQICARAERDAHWRRQLRDVDISWQGLRRDVDCGYGAARRRQHIDLAPWQFTASDLGDRLLQVASIDELFAWLGTETDFPYRFDSTGSSFGASFGSAHFS